MNYKTRGSTAHDAIAVEALLTTSYPNLMASFYSENVLVPALELITKANMTLLSSGSYYVAEADDGSMVGCGGWSLEKPTGTTDNTVCSGHLRHFATHPEWTRCGIGREIYQHCEAAALAAGISELEVYSSLNAEDFYAALGFQRISEISLPIGTVKLPGVWMKRSIKQQDL